MHKRILIQAPEIMSRSPSPLSDFQTASHFDTALRLHSPRSRPSARSSPILTKRLYGVRRSRQHLIVGVHRICVPSWHLLEKHGVLTQRPVSCGRFLNPPWHRFSSTSFIRFPRQKSSIAQPPNWVSRFYSQCMPPKISARNALDDSGITGRQNFQEHLGDLDVSLDRTQTFWQIRQCGQIPLGIVHNKILYPYRHHRNCQLRVANNPQHVFCRHVVCGNFFPEAAKLLYYSYRPVRPPGGHLSELCGIRNVHATLGNLMPKTGIRPNAWIYAGLLFLSPRLEQRHQNLLLLVC